MLSFFTTLTPGTRSHTPLVSDAPEMLCSQVTLKLAVEVSEFEVASVRGTHLLALPGALAGARPRTAPGLVGLRREGQRGTGVRKESDHMGTSVAEWRRRGDATAAR